MFLPIIYNLADFHLADFLIVISPFLYRLWYRQQKKLLLHKLFPYQTFFLLYFCPKLIKKRRKFKFFKFSPFEYKILVFISINELVIAPSKVISDFFIYNLKLMFCIVFSKFFEVCSS